MLALLSWQAFVDPMPADRLHIILHQPEIPPNTGNIIRLCANCGAQLHIILPAAFDLDDKKLRRAGLDYHEFAHMQTWACIEDYQRAHPERRMLAIETSGSTFHSDFSFQATDALLLGSETKGLPAQLLQQLPAEHILRLPMLPGSRSLNLSNATAVVVYEAWRQLGYAEGV